MTRKIISTPPSTSLSIPQKCECSWFLYVNPVESPTSGLKRIHRIAISIDYFASFTSKQFVQGIQ